MKKNLVLGLILALSLVTGCANNNKTANKDKMDEVIKTLKSIEMDIKMQNKIRAKEAKDKIVLLLTELPSTEE